MSEDKTPLKVPETLRDYPTRRPNKIEDPAELPGWVKTALLYIVFEGATHADASNRVNRSPRTLENYASSPAYKQWRGALEEARDDPKLMAKTTMESQIAAAAVDLLWAREAARTAGDYKEVRIGAESILDRFELGRKSKNEDRPTLVINIQGGGIEPIRVETLEIEDNDDAPVRLPMPEVSGGAADHDDD